MRSKRWLILLTLFATACGGAVAAGAETGDEAPTPIVEELPPAVEEPTPTVEEPTAAPTPATINQEFAGAMGDPEAPVTIVEFTDYQCQQDHTSNRKTLIYSDFSFGK